MSSSIPNPNNGKRITGYGVGAPSIRLNPPPIVAARSPTSSDLKYPFGQDWINTSAQLAFTLVGVTAGAAVWATTGGATGVIDTLTGDSGGAISPAAGNLSLLGTANQITTTGTPATITFTIPSTFIAPGSVAATTTLTATLGNITATNGNFVSSTAGKGIMLNSGTASGTTTATLNGRSGQVTITTPSIAAGATFSFALTNSSVTASTTQVLYGLTGGTTGAAVTIQSVTNSAGTSTIVVQNAAGVTANSASLVLTFLVLN